MTSTVVALLTAAAVLQALSVSFQIGMRRKGVGFLLRSPFGTALNMVTEWSLRRGSAHPVLNRLRQKRWVASEVSRAVVCGYFEYATVVRPSVKDILMVILYAASYGLIRLAFGPSGGVVEWLVLVAIIVVAYYGMVTLWILADLAAREATRKRLSCILGTLFRKRTFYSSYTNDLISLGILPKEISALAQETHGLGWWARQYWKVETHREKDLIVEILQRKLEYEASTAELREQLHHAGRTPPRKETHVDTVAGDSLEGVLSPLDSHFARRLRIADPEFRRMLSDYDAHPEGSRAQRKELRRIVDYVRQRLAVNE